MPFEFFINTALTTSESTTRKMKIMKSFRTDFGGAAVWLQNLETYGPNPSYLYVYNVMLALQRTFTPLITCMYTYIPSPVQKTRKHRMARTGPRASGIVRKEDIRG